MCIEEGTCWDEHWVLYGNQFDNKFHIKKINEQSRKRERQTKKQTINYREQTDACQRGGG